MVLDVAFLGGGREGGEEGRTERRILAAQLAAAGFSIHGCMTKVVRVSGLGKEGRKDADFLLR